MSARVLAPRAIGPGWLSDPAWHRAPDAPGDIVFVAPLAWCTATGEVVELPAGYPVNGASIPRLLWPVGHPLEPWVMRSAGLHDYLCRERDARGSAWVHAQFAAGLRVDAQTRWQRVRAPLYATAVRLFGPRWAPTPPEHAP